MRFLLLSCFCKKLSIVPDHDLGTSATLASQQSNGVLPEGVRRTITIYVVLRSSHDDEDEKHFVMSRNCSSIPRKWPLLWRFPILIETSCNRCLRMTRFPAKKDMVDMDICAIAA